MVARAKLGELLLEHHIINAEQLALALTKQKQTGDKIGETLLALGFITEQQFLDFFAQQLHIPFFDLKLYRIDPAIVDVLPESYARLYRAVVLKKQSDGFLLGMSDPLDVAAIDKLRQFISQPISFAIVKEQDLERVFNLIYRRTQAISGYAKALSEEVNREPLARTEKISATNDAPVAKLLDTLFQDAAQMNASDIHIEPYAHQIRVRLRIDGMLHEQILKDPSIMPAITSRLKLSAGLDIAERRLPQDGRFEMETLHKKFDVRLSTMPTPFGESLVMRLLKQSGGLTLEQTGMANATLSRFRELCHKPNGIILVTGPTGSGKSTTLYAALNEMNHTEIKLVTIEDPIEYTLPFAVQIQTNDQIGLSFATVLRGILRHDPDVILLGEMRDSETSNIALRTALTGRLVLSTLHTNDAISAVDRLMNLGTESYMIAATTQAILAQRLMRLVCTHCAEAHTPTQQETQWLSQLTPSENACFQQGKGCAYCSQTGYQGRTAIFELLEFNAPMADALRQNDQHSFHALAQKSLNGKLLMQDAYRLVLQGKTTVSEMMRVINEGYAEQKA